MFERAAWLREYFSLLSSREVKKWLILMVVAFSFYFLMGGSGEWYSPLSAVFSVSRTIGWLLATGFPFVIGGSLILCSDRTRNNIVEYKWTHEEVKFSYLFGSYMALILVVMALVSFAGLQLVLVYLGISKSLAFFLNWWESHYSSPCF